MNDEQWMLQALQLADRAAAMGEVPVGALVVRDDVVLAEGWNQPIHLNDPCAHAEILALRQAGQQAGNYRLPGTTLYVTLEPCIMCVGAMIHARIQRLVFAASDPKTGAAGSVFPLLQDPHHNHQVVVAGGVLAEASRQRLQQFFRQRRAMKKNLNH
ncbi:tRNA adenosine(34) deaminase TadA [Candidatus Venteria ishoeyi]|uniref:tRNA-specific adenosine deaminase n=1 Tax=Candidatus Venteria ishoeyi TaxID=1899563 RepID=A0A1H6FHF4_9GAMM|nr:tRNA adenosine(34) deaminase TadA [Candidatus Venteria ishoeyi]MDM8545563.1 tRNA adenosine(34) deaminase TadA [Candidatus Venteria ishoeyi]SEH08861.1 tRNA-specific adenosine deaminase [Candidatus Venteria ishoeyi]